MIDFSHKPKNQVCHYCQFLFSFGRHDLNAIYIYFVECHLKLFG